MTAKEYNNCVACSAADVMRFAVRCGGRREDCEDAVQEALASLWSHHGSVDAARGKSYLLSAVYRRLMSHFRHCAVVQEYATEVMATSSEDCRPNNSFDIRDAIEQSLRVLPEVQRAILQLRDVEGYSYAEIGETLGLSDKQVQVYLFRARVTMRKQLNLLGYGKDQ
ncbi:MAG: sigma-70 family RNA polymerase sigma factor [Bacteroidales bacterium]|nr:sigma-70 family RNA polymerase sigma factor [Bacteroidales bacterium]